MFGISGDNVVEHRDGRSATTEGLGVPVVITYNHTDPDIMRDGVDRVAIYGESSDRFLVGYEGNETGCLQVTRDGVEELGVSLLGEAGDVPDWTIDPSTIDLDDPPSWLPDGYETPPPVACNRCGAVVDVEDVVTPSRETVGGERFCWDCWTEHERERLETPPESAVERARSLRDLAVDAPRRVPVEELADLVVSDDPEAQAVAIEGLTELAGTRRPGELLDVLPVLAAQVASDEVAVRRETLRCLAELARRHPAQLASVADAVVAHLDPDLDGELLDHAVRYVAAVADEEPDAVRDAIPGLAAILCEDAPGAETAVAALLQIARVRPEPVVPFAHDVLDRAVDGDGNPTALKLLGHLVGEASDVADSAVPQILDLLTSDDYQVRVSAAGLLATLATEHPDAVRPELARILDALDDEDEMIRFRLVSVLSTLAEAYPDDVASATDHLLDALDEEFSHTRENACQALGYLRSEEAVGRLTELASRDPSEEVQEAAAVAVRRIEGQ